MPTDADFLDKLHADPADDATRLVYADWLEEQGGPEATGRAEFLRATVEPAAAKKGEKGEKARRNHLQQLAAELDTDWLAVVSRLAIENCAGQRAKQEARSMRLVRFDFLCERQWQDLRPTDDRGVRFCDGCQQQVHYCDTIGQAREHARAGHCIAVDVGVIRRKDDLARLRMRLGRVSAESLRRERERMQPDPVSAAREQRKRQQQADSAGT